MSEISYDQSEPERIIAEFKALSAEPLPPNRKHLGCGTLMLVPPLLLLGPKVTGASALVLASVSAAAALAGGYLTLFGGSKEMTAIRTRAAEGLHALATQFDQLDADQRRTAALLALIYARYERGPGTFAIYDPEQEAPRLGAALPYVQSVERVLVARSMLTPIFTS